MATLATTAELRAEQDKIAKFQAFDSSYFRGKSCFEGVEDDGTQNYLVFQPVHRYSKRLFIAIIFQRLNLKDCLMKVLNLPLHLKSQ